jgi:hypothetical protein
VELQIDPDDLTAAGQGLKSGPNISAEPKLP